MGRCQAAGQSRLCQRLLTEDGAVPHDHQGQWLAPQLLRQLRKADGAIRRPAGQAAMFGVEEGVVDLATPGVHGADHQGVHVGHVPGHGLQGGDGRAGLVRGKGQSLGSRDADADAGEGPGAHGHGDGQQGENKLPQGEAKKQALLIVPYFLVDAYLQ